MKNVKVIAIGSGAQNVVGNKKAAKCFDVFRIDRKDGCGNDAEMGRKVAEEFFESLDKFVAGSNDEMIFIDDLDWDLCDYFEDK